MAAVAGSLEFVADGVRYFIAGSFTVKYFSRVRTMLIGVDGPYGHSETGVAPGFDCDLANTRDVSMKTLAALTEVTCSVKCADGKQYVLHEAIVEGEPEKDPIGGTITGFQLRGTLMDEV